MPTRLILIRHGITEWNRQGRYCGCKDIGLSREGKKQAKKLHASLRRFDFEKVYSSDRKRSLQTARIIFGRNGVIKVKELRELDFGVLEGLTHKEIKKKYAAVYKQWLADPFRNNIPKAENLYAFRKRINGAMRKIARLNPGKTIAVVCHGGAIGVFITAIFKSRGFWRNIPGAASISIVEYKNRKPRIKLFNETAHLK